MPETSIRDLLQAAVRQSMRGRDRLAVAAYRSALSDLDNARAVTLGADHRSGAIEASPGPGATEVPRAELSEEDQRAVVRRGADEADAAAALVPGTAAADELSRRARLLRDVLGD